MGREGPIRRSVGLRPRSLRDFSDSFRNLATKSGTHSETWAGGRGAPVAFVTGVRHREEELKRAFFSARFVRVLDSLGYARFKNWRLYGEEALADSSQGCATDHTATRRPSGGRRTSRTSA